MIKISLCLFFSLLAISYPVDSMSPTSMMTSRYVIVSAFPTLLFEIVSEEERKKGRKEERKKERYGERKKEGKEKERRWRERKKGSERKRVKERRWKRGSEGGKESERNKEGGREGEREKKRGREEERGERESEKETEISEKQDVYYERHINKSLFKNTINARKKCYLERKIKK